MDISKSYHISAPPLDVWRALVDPEAIDEWGGGPVVMTDEPGSRFTLWGGDIYGTVLSVDSGSRLVEEWYGGPWAHPSVVTFSVDAESGGTLLRLQQTDVPDQEADEIDAGWDEYYLGPLKRLLESR
jgi:activator of HSP90 ATPase